MYISLYTTWHLAHNGSADGLLQEIERKNSYCIETQNTNGFLKGLETMGTSKAYLFMERDVDIATFYVMPFTLIHDGPFTLTLSFTLFSEVAGSNGHFELYDGFVFFLLLCSTLMTS